LTSTAKTSRFIAFGLFSCRLFIEKINRANPLL